jgi:glycosyltransferase involved in cell wall biosynthesis
MKKRILIVSDSPFLDTGFARVARETGIALSKDSRFTVAQVAWFHRDGDKLIPYQIFRTNGQPSDVYAQQSYPEIVKRFKPDLVLTIGDIWMVEHIAGHRRDHQLVGYFPIDGMPVPTRWIDVMKGFDHVVTFGPFGKRALRDSGAAFPIVSIPHGVDIDTFRPRSEEDRNLVRPMMTGKLVGKNFIVGCVARNQPRKQLPRLFKAWRRFVDPGIACQECGEVIHSAREMPTCPVCESTEVRRFDGKPDALLYVHAKPDDRSSSNLYELRDRFGLNGYVTMPSNLPFEGVGYSDERLSLLYNGMDLFTLPTGGEGWGLPILEAMSSGVPCLVTGYSGHLDFCQGVADLIAISEFDTQRHLVEHALVDLDDYVLRLDSFYYEREQFLTKWGAYLTSRGEDIASEMWQTGKFGVEKRKKLGDAGRERAKLFTWDAASEMWVDAISQILDVDYTSVVPNEGVKFVEC